MEEHNVAQPHCNCSLYVLGNSAVPGIHAGKPSAQNSFLSQCGAHSIFLEDLIRTLCCPVLFVCLFVFFEGGGVIDGVIEFVFS